MVKTARGRGSNIVRGRRFIPINSHTFPTGVSNGFNLSNMASSSSVDHSLRQLGGVPLFSVVPQDVRAPISHGSASLTNPGMMSTSFLNGAQNNGVPQLTADGNVALGMHTQQFDSNREINPISILNTLQQKLKSSTPPKYDFTMATPNGGFYSTLEVFGRTFQTQVICAKKQEAKEEVAGLAVNHMIEQMPGLVEEVRKELDKAARSTAKRTQSSFNRQNRRKLKTYVTDDGIPKSLSWLNKHREPGQPLKRPSVLLLEFCQFHHLDRPIYIQDMDPNRTMFSIKIGDRTFRPTLAFVSKNDAKDHTAQIAFDQIYREQLDIERSHIGGEFARNSEIALVPDIPIIQNERTHMKYPIMPHTPPHSIIDSSKIKTESSQIPFSLVSQHPNINSQTSDTKINGHDPLFHPTVIANELGPPPKSEIIERFNQVNFPLQPNPNFMQMIFTPPAPPAPPVPAVNNNNLYTPYAHYHHPYINPAAYNVTPAISVPSLHTDYKRYVSRLHELAQAKKWQPPVYSYTNVYGGFIGEVIIHHKHFQGSKACARKADAKEDVSEMAWKWYTEGSNELGQSVNGSI